MTGNSDGKAGAAHGVDSDQFEAFRYELGTSNRENVLASFDRGDDYARMRFAPLATNPALRQSGDPADPLLAGWKNFRLTTTDRDLDAEKQDRLHDGQLHRLNRQARGEVIQQPVRNDMFRAPPVHQNVPALNILANADSMAVAKALRFKGTYNSSKPRAPVPISHSSVPSNRPAHFAPPGSLGRGGYMPNGRGGHSSNMSSGRNGATRPGSLNPHSDIHADQGLPNRKKKVSVVRGGNSNFQAGPMRGAPPVQAGRGTVATSRPANSLHPPAQINRGRSGTLNQQQSVRNTNGAHVAPMMGRTNSTRSSASITSSTLGGSSSGVIFATARRPPPTHQGYLATHDEFMSAFRKSGLDSKHAPKPNEGKDERQRAEPTKSGEIEVKSAKDKGLLGSKYAS